MAAFVIFGALFPFLTLTTQRYTLLGTMQNKVLNCFYPSYVNKIT